MMGITASVPDRDDSSRAASPLSGDDEGYDGLPRLTLPASTDFQVAYSQAVDGLPTFSPAAQLATKAERVRQSDARSSSGADLHDDVAEPEQNDPAPYDLEHVAGNTKAEPKSPQIVKSKKKKKRRKSKNKAVDDADDRHFPAPASIEADRVASVVAEEVTDLPSARNNEEAPAPSMESHIEAPASRKKKKKKSKSNKAKAPQLDLNEDPIAGSDEEAVVPSSDKPSRRRKTHHDDNGSSGKFKKRSSIPAVSERAALPFDDILNEEPQAEVANGTQGDISLEARGPESNGTHPAPAANDFLRRSREPEEFTSSQDSISPSVTRQDRRSRVASTTSASASLAGALAGDENAARLFNELSNSHIKTLGSDDPTQPADEDAMDVDSFAGSPDGSVNRAASEDGQAAGSDYSGDLENHNEDFRLEDETELPHLEQAASTSGSAPEAGDMMSTLDDDALMAMASTQLQPATDDNRSRSNHSSGEDNAQGEDVFSKPSGSHNGTRSRSTVSSAIGPESSRQRGSQARASATESLMALQFMPENSRLAADTSDSEVVTGSNADRDVELGQVSSALVDYSSLPNSTTTLPGTRPQVKDNRAAAYDETPRRTRLAATRTSANPSPRGSRTYARQPKPSFFERSEEETAQAFAQLPSNEVAATPKSSKPKGKRRLPIELPDAETTPSGPATKRQRSSLHDAPGGSARAPRRGRDDASAMRGSTGLLTGVLTKTEVAQVDRAVETFRSNHNLTQQEVNAIIQANPKDRSIRDNTMHELLWSRIIEACPTRPRQKLLNWCRQKYHNFVARATWTPEQDDELRQMVQQNGTKWNVIGQLINRHQKDVRDRWRNYLIAGNNQNKHQWSEEEQKTFLSIVAEAMNVFQALRSDPTQDDIFATGKTNEELVDWNVVAEKMDFTRTRLQCQEKWRRMRETNKINGTALAASLEPDQRWRLRRARQEIDTMSHADMYHIVCAIPALDGGAKEDVSMNWKPILENQRKKFHRYTAMLLWNRLRQLVPDHESKNVQECAKELITMYQSDGGTFSIPGNGAFDEAQEEELLRDIRPPRIRGTGKPKPGKGQKKRDLAPAEGRVVSEQYVVDSDSDGLDEAANDGDSSRANFNETSPAPEEASGDQGQNGRGDRDGSLDLANDERIFAPRHDDRGGSIDHALNPDVDGEQLDGAAEREVQQDNASPKPRKKSKSTKSKGKEDEVTSSVKRHKKRYSGEMMVDFAAPQTGGDSAKASRKRPRVDTAALTNGSAEGQTSGTRKSKRTKHAPQVERPAEAASSDDDVEDIPAHSSARG